MDTLRFYAAAMVVVCHLTRNLPVAPPGEAEARFFHELALIAHGQAAVGLFFVISGFCIHFGQSANLKIDTPTFLVRRTVRIGVPVLAVSLLAASWGVWATEALNSVLWSLYCELAYYVTYPVLLACRRRWPMTHLLALAILLSAVLVFLQTKRDFLQDYGLATVLVCYPLWLAGAWLAERHHLARLNSYGSIYLWRVTALALCWLFPFGPFGPIDVSAAVKLGLIGLFSIFYLPAELARWQDTAPSAWSELLGRSSYSLYLVHILPVAFLLRVPIGISFWPAMAVELVSIAIFTFAAYWLCEAPAHQLAKAIGRNKPTGLRAFRMRFGRSRG